MHMKGTESVFTPTTVNDGCQTNLTLSQHQIAAAWPRGSDQSHTPGWYLLPLQAQALVEAAAVAAQTPTRQSHAQHQATTGAAQSAAEQGASCTTTSTQLQLVQSLEVRRVAKFILG